MKSFAKELINEMWGYFIGILFWPTSIKLLWSMYTHAALDFRERAMIETLKVQNKDPGCWVRLRGEMMGFILSVVLGFMLQYPWLIGAAVLLFLISFTELLLRQQAAKEF